MIDFELTDEQKDIQRMARQFVAKEIMPITRELDEKEEHSPEIIEKLFDVGLMNFPIPVEYDGPGLDTLTTMLVTEELNYGCAGIATTVAANSLATYPILIAGTPEQKEKYLSFMCEKPRLAAFGLTEPSVGSDAAGLSTTAVREGDYYRLNGSKCFITNGGVANLYTIFATVDRSKGIKGITAFIVPASTPGISGGKKEHKMGLRCSNTTDVILEDVMVPVENRLGDEGEGFKIAMKTLNKARINVGASATGVARAALDAATSYSKQRIQFGKPISEFQAIQFMLADMAIQIEAARMLVWQAAYMEDRGLPCIKEAAIAKTFASDMAMKVTTDAVQVFGGYGFTREFLVEKYMRDVKIMQIYDGTNQIQRMIIARQILQNA